MTGEIGQLLLSMALGLALLQCAGGFVGGKEGAASSQNLARWSGIGAFACVAFAFAALVLAYVASDFSVINVAQNSHSTKPLIYRITGAWGNHEGSMLLWLLVLTIFSAAIAAQKGFPQLVSTALGVQGLLTIAFLLFILFTSNPFLRVDPAPFEGAGLNPLLQDIGLAVHPPMLYIGYVGLSATFAFAAAAMILKVDGPVWTAMARPFLLVAWSALTVGIALGSWWAYYELGWGGFWFWDPVENASLMPWLVATALLHSAMATERNGAFHGWTLLLAIAAFSLSLIGTFLVRSGVLSSVHSFANDPERGVFMLGLIGAAIGGSLLLFALRAPEGRAQGFETASRETALLLNNIFLTAAVTAVFIGTLYPLLLDALTGEKISVGPPYFALTFVPIFLALVLLVPLGPRLLWRGDAWRRVLRGLFPALGVALVAALVTLALIAPLSLMGALCLALVGWLFVSAAGDLRRQGVSLRTLAVACAHAGLGVTLLGVTGTGLWRSETLALLGRGETASIAGYELRLDNVEEKTGANYRAQRADVTVLRNGETVTQLHSEKRFFPVEGQETTETGIRTDGVSDIYIALGDDRGQGRWTLRAYFNPLAPLIWVGAGIMALGGLFGLFARRARGRRMAAA